LSPVDFLLVSICLTSALLSFVFWIAWRSLGKEPFALTWCITFALITLQRALNLRDEWFPDRNSYWIVVTAFSILTVTLGLIGHRQRVRRPTLWPELTAVAAVVQLAVTWFTIGQPHVGLRMGLQPLHAGPLALWMAAIIYRYRPRPLLAEVAAAAVHGLFGLLQIAAGCVALLQGARGDQYYLDLYLMINFLAMPAAYTGMAIFMVFILASDLAERMRDLARTDPLTGVLNRRGFEESALRVLAQAERGRQPLSVILADVDRFKEINDRWGHAAGDRALQLLVEQLCRERRKDDLVARIGGDEFALLLPNTEARQAVELAEQIRRSLGQLGLHVAGKQIELRVSFGVAERNETSVNAESLIHAADKALYSAKQAGRNQVHLESGTPMEKTPDTE